MRLIDADALKNRIDVIINSMIDGDETETELKFFNMINHVLHTSVDETPTIEAEPVRHGRWEPVPYTAHCSCGKKYDKLLYNCTVCNHVADWQPYGLKYCPNCGAKMDKGES